MVTSVEMEMEMEISVEKDAMNMILSAPAVCGTCARNISYAHPEPAG